MSKPIRQRVIEGLKKARNFIKPQGAWFQGWFAKDALKVDCSATAPEAVCFCAAGALGRAFGDDDEKAFDCAVLELERSIYGKKFDPLESLNSGLVIWNDEKGRTQEEVVRVFDNTIRRLQRSA